jgi:WD40 repeat protein
MCADAARAAEVVAPFDFTKDVAPIFAKYCAGCHNDRDSENNFSLETFTGLKKGGDRGTAIVPGRADASLLIRVLTAEIEPAMPPEGEARPTEAEIAILRAWIDAGAKGPDGTEAIYPELSAPEIAPAPSAKASVSAIAVSPDGQRVALGRYRHVELVDPATQKALATSPELPGKVNAISFSRDGKTFVAATGVAGLYGAAIICRTEDATIVSQIRGHHDTLYDARLSPDGNQLATCSYDKQINLWDVAKGTLVRSFGGHNGAVFEVSFAADGKTLASASADDTVKVWNVATGERLDTLGQPEGEQSTVTISPDAKWIVAGGADRQIRMWRFVSKEKAKINPLTYSRTAHNSPVVKLAYSPDGTKLVSASEGRELILWEAQELLPVFRYEEQPDVITGIAFAPSGAAFYVSRMDGSWKRYDISGGPAVARHSGGEGMPGAADASPEVAARLERDEMEPNNLPAAANQVTANSLVRGVVVAASDGEPDADSFLFHARAGQQIVLEIKAARMKSPLDSKLEVLDAKGQPIPRLLLQAVRSSYFTFRGHNSTDHNDFRMHGAADMELNEYVYANGEVMKLWMLPRGPDSGFLVYPGKGNRDTFFGTSAITHPLNETVYVVQPHPPGAQLIPNGLPQYTLYYENDDDGRRKLGADSRIMFTVPADGDYVVRVTDVRGMGGEQYKYELVLRKPRPSFKIKLNAKELEINAGSGKEFSVDADRIDEFDGEIRVDVTGLPPGFHASTPLVIEAGQMTAFGTITADADAPAPTAENSKGGQVTATAMINGKEVKRKAIPLGELKLAAKPKLLVQVLPTDQAKTQESGVATQLEIEPGETIAAIVKVERNGFDGEIKFGGEDSGRNLPHGVYVDNIGLNGMTLLAAESERTFYITARKWVPETTRLFHLRAEVEGNQTSWPVTLHVRKQSAAVNSEAAGGE